MEGLEHNKNEWPDTTALNDLSQVEAALLWATRGFPIFPCEPQSKKPFIANGFKDATIDARQIKLWWKRWPGAMIGIPCGKITGIWVLDVDTAKGEEEGADGRETVAALEREHGALPKTRVHYTPSGGRHYFFQMPDTVPEIRCRTKFVSGCDIRAQGGYVILPPSINADGKNYEINTAEEIAAAPDWLIKLALSKNNAIRETVREAAKAAGKTPFERQLEDLANCKPGVRNDLLNEMAFKAGPLVSAGRYDEGEAKALLTAAAKKCGLDDAEIEKTIQSGLSAGKAGDGRPTIIWEEGRFAELIKEVIDALKGRTQVFKGASGLVHVGTTPQGQMAIIPYSWQTLQLCLSAVIRWKKWKKDELVDASCPKQVAEALYHLRGNDTDLYFLKGVTNIPVLRPDGSIFQSPGYDEQTKLFFDPGEGGWPVVPENVDYRKARRALDKLRDLLSEFPFEADHYRSVALSAMLTGSARHLFPTAPLFAVSSRMAATGKTLLAQLVGILTTGGSVPTIPLPRSEEELQKSLTGLLLSGQQVICFDNVSRPLSSDTLCNMITTETFQNRLLGENTMLKMSTCATFIATGINLKVQADLVRRSLLCMMNAKCERPEERVFKRNIIAHAKKNRRELVVAALTVLRGYSQVKEKAALSTFGSFEEWSDLVRGALVWLGEPDPIESQEALMGDDPTREALGNVLRAWRFWQRKHKNEFKTVKDALADEGIAEAFAAAVGGKESPTVQRCGIWLGRNIESYVDGLCFEKGGKAKQQKWRVKKAKVEGESP